MAFIDELKKSDEGYSRAQKYLIYISSALLFICMFLKFWIDVKTDNFHFAIALGIFLIFFLYIVSKSDENFPIKLNNKSSRVEAIFALFMVIVLFIVVLFSYGIIANLIDLFLVTFASIINIIVFLPHALSKG